MSNPEETYYVYALANPLKTGQYFYIGFSGKESRLDEHLKCYDSDKNYHKKNTIKQIQDASHEIIFIKILENVDRQTAIDKEIELIALYGRRDLGTGILTNMTDGGEGGNGNFIDLTSQKFNMIMVLSHEKDRYWLCKCDCGNEKIILSTSFKSGKTKSCGCHDEERRISHGKTKTPLYRTWINMRGWCNRVNHTAYKYYGGRGIKVCERWMNSFENFLEDIGEKPSSKHVLDRINKNADFEPINCRWSLKKKQQNNMKNNRFLTIRQETKTISEWATHVGDYQMVGRQKKLFMERRRP